MTIVTTKDQFIQALLAKADLVLDALLAPGSPPPPWNGSAAQ
jgi:hypothetical protein